MHKRINPILMLNRTCGNIFADTIDHGKKGGSKNLQCKFCDRSFSGMSTTRAVAHILGRPVMGQTTSGIKSCIAIKKAEDGRHTDLKKGMSWLL